MIKLSEAEEMLREIYGYSDRQLEAEIRQAEKALEKEGRQEATDAEFDALLARIRERQSGKGRKK